MVSMIVLPFHIQWRGVNQRVLEEAPCSVAVLVDRGYSGGSAEGASATAVQNVCILFFGGPDDTEALELGGRMAEHPAVKVAVIRFIHKEHGDEVGEVEEFIGGWEGRVELIEKVGANKIEDEILATGRSGDYNLIIVGKGACGAHGVGVARVAEHPELGPVGDVLASSGQGIVSSVLVVQKQLPSQAKVPKINLGGDDDEQISTVV